MKKTILPLLFITTILSAQAPTGYYNEATGLTGYALKSKLHEIISRNNVNWHYGDLTNFYNQTDLDHYYDHDTSNTTILLDMYSEIPNGPDAYEYTTANIIGSASAEGLGWNREHMMPQSTFYSNYPMYSDLFYVVPTDARINQLRSNYMYGISSTTASNIFYNFTNGSKIGRSAIPNYVYTGRVYEPIDEFKGDIARSLLYFAVRYEGKLGTFNYNNNANPASDTNPLDGTEERAFDNAYLDMLIQWHQQDPVSQREIDRNNAVYNLQKNRNPFIDNPSWVTAIWGTPTDTIAPLAPTNLSVFQTSAYFTTLQWSPSTDADVIGYKIYQDGVYVASTKGTSISIDHLTPSTNYTFTVKAYDNGYLYSNDSNTVSVTTLATDQYARDLYVSKYLEGTGNNKALEITNKIGHTVNLSDYRLSIQMYGSGNYYFVDPYELEGTIENNQSFVVLNPNANFSCYSINEAKFVTAAPQMTFTGSNYLELRYKSSTIDAIGVRGQSNSAILTDVSLYRKPTISNPNLAFDSNEWDQLPVNYCQNLGTLATDEVSSKNIQEYTLYPNPVKGKLSVKGNNLDKVSQVAIYDLSGKKVYSEKNPFKDKNTISTESLTTGNYLLEISNKTYPFIKK